MNIRVHLSKVAGSDEKTIEYIERCIVNHSPFGLACAGSVIVFMPKTFKAYWLWADGSPGPVFEAIGIKEFVDTIKMQYLSHKELVDTNTLLEISRLLVLKRAVNGIEGDVKRIIS